MLLEKKPELSVDYSEKTVWRLTKRQLCDLECLLNGTFHPLTGFLDKEDYLAVCNTMRLSNGTLWPMPVTLDVPQSFAAEVQPGEHIVLTNDENTPLALLQVSANWRPDKELEARLVFGSTDKKHPGVDYLFNTAGQYYLGGTVTALAPLLHYDFIQYRHTPEQLKQLFRIYGWSRIIAFQTRNPIHRAHYELTRRAAEKAQANLLLHPVVGMTKEGDVDYITRVHCYEAILMEYPKQGTVLSLLPLAMRMAGPREALWHALIRKNFGITHFIVGRDHAGPGLNSQGFPFYDPYAAQTLLRNNADEIGIEIMPFPAMTYVKEKATFCTVDEVHPEETTQDISGTRLRELLEKRLEIPEWFTFPAVIQVLRKAYPPKHQQGYTLLLTGLSGSGKSTIAKAFIAHLLQSSANQRQVTLLDGDAVRHNLSNGLGFSKKDRDIQINRIGYVAAEITKHKGIAVCAAIAPYAAMRQQIRQSISQYGGFIEVYIATPIEVCKQRDIKGLYRKAESGLIAGFTGVNDPYEVPGNPEVIIDTSIMSVFDAVQRIVASLTALGYIEEEP